MYQMAEMAFCEIVFGRLTQRTYNIEAISFVLHLSVTEGGMNPNFQDIACCQPLSEHSTLLIPLDLIKVGKIISN